MNDRTDFEILRAFEERSEGAIRAVSDRYGGVCARIAAGILSDHRDREECVSDAYMHLWNAIPPAKPASLRAYLYSVVRNLAMDRYRKLHAEKRDCDLLSELGDCLTGSDSVEQTLDAQSASREISEFLRTLPVDYRTVFIRRYYYCLPVSRIAELGGLSEGTVKSILSRTRKKLKKVLEEKGITV